VPDQPAPNVLLDNTSDPHQPQNTNGNSRPVDQSTTTEMRREFRWFEFGSLGVDLVLAVIGAVAVFIYGGQLRVMNHQLTEMQGTSRQTDQLIDLYQKQLTALQRQVTDTHQIALAADSQANAANKNVAAAERFAVGADNINAQIRRSVEQFERMASASEASIKTAQETAKIALDASVAASRLDERPWVMVRACSLPREPDENYTPSAVVSVVNTGKTPAMRVTVMIEASIWSAAWEDNPPPTPTETPKYTRSTFVLAPGTDNMSVNADPVKHSQEALDNYRSGKNVYFIRTRINYVDSFNKSHRTTACMYHVYGEELGFFHHCPEGSEVDDTRLLQKRKDRRKSWTGRDVHLNSVQTS